MIPRTPSRSPRPWQRQLAEGVRDLSDLLRHLDLTVEDLRGPWALDALPGSTDNTAYDNESAETLELARRAAESFPVRVPLAFVDRMRRGDPEDPLLLQVLPTAPESRATTGYGADPLEEEAARVAPGMLHKYRGRVLLVTTGACAVHCRYCFRRHYPYAETGAGWSDWDAALDYLAAHPEIDEVILSGGDPLSAADRRLRELAHRLAAIPSLQRLRVHTRLPVVLPQRVDDELLEWLTGTRLKPVMVIHANHANELDEAVHHALQRLATAGVALLNQSVLLARVNDSVDALEALSRRLFDVGVWPYYLHLLDRVQGAAHFDVPEARGQQLMSDLAARLPGYLVPRLVREDAGATAKTPVPPSPSLRDNERSAR